MKTLITGRVLAPLILINMQKAEAMLLVQHMYTLLNNRFKVPMLSMLVLLLLVHGDLMI